MNQREGKEEDGRVCEEVKKEEVGSFEGEGGWEKVKIGKGGCLFVERGGGVVEVGIGEEEEFVEKEEVGWKGMKGMRKRS